MRRIVFPPVETATEDGLVAIGGDLEVDTLITAYHQGIFPWPISLDYPLAWFSPDPRGIIELGEVHLSKSFTKFLKKNPYQVTFNQAFDKVIDQCARTYRKNQPSTWITPDIIEGYEKLFKQELAYSVEIWQDSELIAGLYGVCMGDFVSGESMFTKEDNASKYALYSLILRLKDKGIHWLDTQMVTPVVEGFGGKYISRPEFLQMLSKKDWTRKRSEIF
jgi:leucyl/phenylalanyl-tRNA--protein transferase